MSVNSSSSSLVLYCEGSKDAVFISYIFVITKTILLIPLFSLVLYLAHQRWRQRRSFTTTSHSDIFTFHMAAMELIYVLGNAVYFCGLYAELFAVMLAGFYAASIVFLGQTFFHMLTCVERYLAVVHPVTYRGLRQSGGVRIRNISCACVWVLCSVWSASLYGIGLPFVPFFTLFGVSLAVVSFCSLRVLCVLIRPGPGEVGGNNERVDQSKQRAFHTMMAIMGVLWLWFIVFIVCLALDTSDLLSYEVGCVVLVSGYWFSLPSSLVSPVLFLHRAGKLPCCNYSNQ